MRDLTPTIEELTDGGHMMYTHSDELRRLKADLMAWMAG